MTAKEDYSGADPEIRARGAREIEISTNYTTTENERNNERNEETNV